MIIGIANNLYPPHGRGSGAEVIAAKMADELRREGHEVFIITTKPLQSSIKNTNNCYYLVSHYEQLANWPNFKKIAWHIGQLLFPPHQQALKTIIKTRKPDLVITHNLIGLGFFLPQLLYRQNIKHKHILHDIQLLHPSGLMYWQQEKIISSLAARSYQFLTRRAFKNTTQVQSPSQWLLNLHQQHNFFNQSINTVQPNFNLAKIQPKKINTPVRFSFTGQIEKHKGINTLISAWEKAGLSAEQAQLIIAGAGSLAQAVATKIKKFDNLQYIGYLDRHGINHLLDNTDVVVTPSLVYENSPTSLWEAAEHGCRALASDIGGIPELKPYLEMTLVPPGDIDALAQAFKQYAKSGQ